MSSWDACGYRSQRLGDEHGLTASVKRYLSAKTTNVLYALANNRIVAATVILSAGVNAG